MADTLYYYGREQILTQRLTELLNPVQHDKRTAAEIAADILIKAQE